MLALDDFLERADRIFDLHELAADAGEDLGDVEGLRQEALDLAGAAAAYAASASFFALAIASSMPPTM